MYSGAFYKTKDGINIIFGSFNEITFTRSLYEEEAISINLCELEEVIAIYKRHYPTRFKALSTLHPG